MFHNINFTRIVELSQKYMRMKRFVGIKLDRRHESGKSNKKPGPQFGQPIAQSGQTPGQGSPARKIKVHTRQYLFPTYIQYISSLDVQSQTKFTKKAGIICTIGPASRDLNVLTEMMKAGMDIARLNFSHGSHEYHKETIVAVRKAVEQRSKEVGRPIPIAIALDTKGPEIRTGINEKGVNVEEELKRGSVLFLQTDRKFYDKGNTMNVFVDYQKLPKLVSVGSSIYIDDGLIQLKVQEIDKTAIKCVVVNGGMMGSKKGVNLPGIAVDLPSISKKDEDDIRFGIENDIDIIFASFIRRKEDVERIKELLSGKGEHIRVIAKIENYQGIENMDEIIDASDGVMVARGDLGIEIPTERVFLAQKRMIASCNLAGKPVICATQMLESMIKKPRPTRAESSDVANAILDGADCVMLSGETAKGDYPVECVGVMSDICRSAEAAVQHLQYFQDISRMVPAPTDTTQSIAIAAVAAANKILATGILVMTSTGYSAIIVSKFRPPCNIFAITESLSVARRCTLHRGIVPILHTRARIDDWALYIEDKIRTGLKIGIDKGHINKEDRVVVLTGWKRGKGNTNTMRIVHVTQDIIERIYNPPKS